MVLCPTRQKPVAVDTAPRVTSTFWLPVNSKPATMLAPWRAPPVASVVPALLVVKTLVKSPPLSTAEDSAARPKFDRSVLVAEFQPFLRWLRNVGIAIAARIPMMIMTTRSSIRVKPCSLSAMDLRIRTSMSVSLHDGSGYGGHPVDVTLIGIAGRRS